MVDLSSALPPNLQLNSVPPVTFSFAVVLFPLGLVPNILDIRFSKVSGISSKIDVQTVDEGGENLFLHKLPNKVNYETLKLERGMVVGSPLNLEFNLAMSTLTLAPGNVLLAMLNENGLPTAAWLYLKTYPSNWTVSDLDAGKNDVMIDTMEFTYERFLSLRV